MNEAWGSANLQLIFRNDLEEDAFRNMFHEENIISVKLPVTLPDGSVHIIDAYITSLIWDEFIKIENKKATEQSQSA